MTTSHHAEWLSLLEISGPFLSPPVLERVFPQGLDAPDPDHAAKLRLAYEEWAEELQKPDPDPAIHDAWVRLVLSETLEFTPDVLVEAPATPDELSTQSPEHHEDLRPDYVIVDPQTTEGTRSPQMLVTVWASSQDLDQPVPDRAWAASPADRMKLLCRDTGVRLGLVTNGERWMLVDAPDGESPAFVSWYAHLWSPEPLTLRAFRSLLGMRRFFGVADEDRLERLLADSASYQVEVTDLLGSQVRRAVEVLVTAIDRADADSGGTLLRDVRESRLYEAALTVMMRLVFLFYAEENRLLPLNDALYAEHYAASTLYGQLQEAADRVGAEVLERRQDAWSRLLATFRAIYGGVDHESLHLLAYGSSLFDPDRFPFLEGRTTGTTWLKDPAQPLPIDNRTVLLLLRSLQVLEIGGREGRKLSFRALDIEQIGHVYEGLLDHTARRADEAMVSLVGAKKKNYRYEPELPVQKLHELLHHDEEGLIAYLIDETKKTERAIRRALEKELAPVFAARIAATCGGDQWLAANLLPFHAMLRVDPWGDPVVIKAGSVYVTEGEDRRSTGTHYTPRVLTEEIVRHALEPVVYTGPAEGKQRDAWVPKPPIELLSLKLCDPAMGSGAFLVQACRYLAERLVEAWDRLDQPGPITAEGQPASGSDDIVPDQPEERLAFARRLVADRCLYGVDVNPLAVEMAKLSLWLITVAKDRPFGFLDHALKCGDSLLGVHDLDQIRHFHPDPLAGRDLHLTLFDPTAQIDDSIAEALELRQELEAFPVRDIRDARRKGALHGEAEQALERVRLLGDLVTAAAISVSEGQAIDLDDRVQLLADRAAVWLESNASEMELELRAQAREFLNVCKPDGKSDRRTFHWPVEFPEVFEAGGFDAVIMNPPFLGGKKISTNFGTCLREFLVNRLARGVRGANADLAAFFMLRAFALVRPHGVVGSLATNTIGEGQTRKVGLDQVGLLGNIYRANSSRPWPGDAVLEIAQLWVTRCGWNGRVELDGRPVPIITSSLEAGFDVEPPPGRLDSNTDLAFKGASINGTGFILSIDEAEGLVKMDERNRDVLFPYLVSRDLNSDPEQRPSRWIINFFDWSEDRSREYPDVFAIAEQRIKPQRLALKGKQHLKERWWVYESRAVRLYQLLSGLDHAIVMGVVSKTVLPSYVQTGPVFGDALVVFPTDDLGMFGLLSSGTHWAWTIRNTSTLRVDIRYVPSACFETLALPTISDQLVASGQRLHSRRAEIMRHNALGMTRTYNEVNNPDAQDSWVEELRHLHAELERAVFDAYGWSDISPSFGHFETQLGVRFALTPKLTDEVLGRLRQLNAQRSSSPDVGSTKGA